MTRKIKTMDPQHFENIVDQLKPFSEENWSTWKKFVNKIYGIPENGMGENHFFLYIIPKVIQLHGYGDPLLDKNMALYIKMLAKAGFESYFSCNPANIDIDKTVAMFESGLNYIKYSIESTDDQAHKEVRGKASNFTDSYRKILRLLELKETYNYKTTIVITMLDLNRDSQQEDYEKLKKAFSDKDVYIYMKSEDQQWYRKDVHGTKSVHWTEICRHPWMSMTIKSDGDAAMCMEDYNNEIVLGNIADESLYDIWNGEKYKKLRLPFMLVGGIVPSFKNETQMFVCRKSKRVK
jgi:MoaA/NifB/PqqE/SkfB family radical SAM enzyme